MNACGVVVAMLQGHSWVPIPSNGSGMNVGTVLVVPPPVSCQLPGGEGASHADVTRTGRRTRSSPRPGKPVTWRRGPACPQL
jgi:hypothetical protein